MVHALSVYLLACLYEDTFTCHSDVPVTARQLFNWALRHRTESMGRRKKPVMQIPGWPKLMVCLLMMQADVAHCPAEAGFWSVSGRCLRARSPTWACLVPVSRSHGICRVCEDGSYTESWKHPNKDKWWAFPRQFMYISRPLTHTVE